MSNPEVKVKQKYVTDKKGKLLKPTHQRVEEDMQFQAWEVTLYIRKDAIDPRLYATTYYVRAPYHKPALAVTFAHRLWELWEKEGKGFSEFNRYPKAEEKAEAEEIREQDYERAWKDAQKHIHKFVGPQKNPSGFAFFPPGYMTQASDIESSDGVDDEWLRLPD